MIFGGGSWWHEQIEVWHELEPFVRDVPLLAVITIIDAVTGLSRIVAVRFGGEKRRGFVLLAILLICEIRSLYWGDFLPFQPEVLEAPNNIAMFPAYMHHLKVSLFYENLLSAIEACSAIICAFLAKSQGRSFFLWLPIGLLGNVGAIVWLLINRKKVDVLAAAGQSA